MKRGRPARHGAPMRVVSMTLPRELVYRLDVEAARFGMSRSEYVVHLLAKRKLQ